MKRLLQRAYCEDVLVIAAVGNGRGSKGPLFPAAFESVPPPNAEQCERLGREMDPRLKRPIQLKGLLPYRPLVHAVSSVDIYDERLITMRDLAGSRIAAYGLGVVARAEDGYTEDLSGTSASAPIVAGLAQVVWSAQPKLDAHGVMAALYAGGRPLDFKANNLWSRTEFCLDEKKNRCDSWPPRRVSLCTALNAAGSRIGKLACVDPASAIGKDYFPSPPPPPSSPAMAPPPDVDAPCRVQNCGAPSGPPSEQLPSAVLPEGVAVCPSCYLYANWYGVGNARLYGKATDGPRPPFSAVVNVYDTSWHGQSFTPFGMYTSQPRDQRPVRQATAERCDRSDALGGDGLELHGIWVANFRPGRPAHRAEVMTILPSAAGLLCASLLVLTSCKSPQPPTAAPVDALTDDEICIRICELEAEVPCADKSDCLTGCKQTNQPSVSPRTGLASSASSRTAPPPSPATPRDSGCRTPRSASRRARRCGPARTMQKRQAAVRAVLERSDAGRAGRPRLGAFRRGRRFGRHGVPVSAKDRIAGLISADPQDQVGAVQAARQASSLANCAFAPTQFAARSEQ